MRLCPVVSFLFTLKHFCTKIFISLNIYKMSHTLFSGWQVFFRTALTKIFFSTFLSAKTCTLLVRTLQTKSGNRTTTYAVNNKCNQKNCVSKSHVTFQSQACFIFSLVINPSYQYMIMYQGHVISTPYISTTS